MATTLYTLISGGQTGSDRAALDFGLAHDIPIGGWCPKDGWAEDFPEAPGLLSSYPQLQPTDYEDIVQRTYHNILDSTATLILDPPEYHSTGTKNTISLAEMKNKPFFVYTQPSDWSGLIYWMKKLPEPLTLNVAGPRQSEWPGAYDTTYQLLERIAKELATA